MGRDVVGEQEVAGLGNWWASGTLGCCSFFSVSFVSGFPRVEEGLQYDRRWRHFSLGISPVALGCFVEPQCLFSLLSLSLSMVLVVLRDLLPTTILTVSFSPLHPSFLGIEYNAEMIPNAVF